MKINLRSIEYIYDIEKTRRRKFQRLYFTDQIPRSEKLKKIFQKLNFIDSKGDLKEESLISSQINLLQKDFTKLNALLKKEFYIDHLQIKFTLEDILKEFSKNKNECIKEIHLVGGMVLNLLSFKYLEDILMLFGIHQKNLINKYLINKITKEPLDIDIRYFIKDKHIDKLLAVKEKFIEILERKFKGKNKKYEICQKAFCKKFYLIDKKVDTEFYLISTQTIPILESIFIANIPRKYLFSCNALYINLSNIYEEKKIDYTIESNYKSIADSILHLLLMVIDTDHLESINHLGFLHYILYISKGFVCLKKEIEEHLIQSFFIYYFNEDSKFYKKLISNLNNIAKNHFKEKEAFIYLAYNLLSFCHKYFNCEEYKTIKSEISEFLLIHYDHNIAKNKPLNDIFNSIIDEPAFLSSSNKIFKKNSTNLNFYKRKHCNEKIGYIELKEIPGLFLINFSEEAPSQKSKKNIFNEIIFHLLNPSIYTFETLFDELDLLLKSSKSIEYLSEIIKFSPQILFLTMSKYEKNKFIKILYKQIYLDSRKQNLEDFTNEILNSSSKKKMMQILACHLIKSEITMHIKLGIELIDIHYSKLGFEISLFKTLIKNKIDYCIEFYSKIIDPLLNDAIDLTSYTINYLSKATLSLIHYLSKEEIAKKENKYLVAYSKLEKFYSKIISNKIDNFEYNQHFEAFGIFLLKNKKILDDFLYVNLAKNWINQFLKYGSLNENQKDDFFKAWVTIFVLSMEIQHENIHALWNFYWYKIICNYEQFTSIKIDQIIIKYINICISQKKLSQLPKILILLDNINIDKKFVAKFKKIREQYEKKNKEDIIKDYCNLISHYKNIKQNKITIESLQEFQKIKFLKFTEYKKILKSCYDQLFIFIFSSKNNLHFLEEIIKLYLNKNFVNFYLSFKEDIILKYKKEFLIFLTEDIENANLIKKAIPIILKIISSFDLKNPLDDFYIFNCIIDILDKNFNHLDEYLLEIIDSINKNFIHLDVNNFPLLTKTIILIDRLEPNFDFLTYIPINLIIDSSIDYFEKNKNSLIKIHFNNLYILSKIICKFTSQNEGDKFLSDTVDYFLINHQNDFLIEILKGKELSILGLQIKTIKYFLSEKNDNYLLRILEIIDAEVFPDKELLHASLNKLLPHTTLGILKLIKEWAKIPVLLNLIKKDFSQFLFKLMDSNNKNDDFNLMILDLMILLKINNKDFLEKNFITIFNNGNPSTIILYLNKILMSITSEDAYLFKFLEKYKLTIINNIIKFDNNIITELISDKYNLFFPKESFNQNEFQKIYLELSGILKNIKQNFKEENIPILYAILKFRKMLLCRNEKIIGIDCLLLQEILLYDNFDLMIESFSIIEMMSEYSEEKKFTQKIYNIYHNLIKKVLNLYKNKLNSLPKTLHRIIDNFISKQNPLLNHHLTFNLVFELNNVVLNQKYIKIYQSINIGKIISSIKNKERKSYLKNLIRDFSLIIERQKNNEVIFISYYDFLNIIYKTFYNEDQDYVYEIIMILMDKIYFSIDLLEYQMDDIENTIRNELQFLSFLSIIAHVSKLIFYERLNEVLLKLFGTFFKLIKNENLMLSYNINLTKFLFEYLKTLLNSLKFMNLIQTNIDENLNFLHVLENVLFELRLSNIDSLQKEKFENSMFNILSHYCKGILSTKFTTKTIKNTYLNELQFVMKFLLKNFSKSFISLEGIELTKKIISSNDESKDYLDMIQMVTRSETLITEIKNNSLILDRDLISNLEDIHEKNFLKLLNLQTLYHVKKNETGKELRVMYLNNIEKALNFCKESNHHLINTNIMIYLRNQKKARIKFLDRLINICFKQTYNETNEKFYEHLFYVILNLLKNKNQKKEKICQKLNNFFLKFYNKFIRSDFFNHLETETKISIIIEWFNHQNFYLNFYDSNKYKIIINNIKLFVLTISKSQIINNEVFKKIIFSNMILLIAQFNDKDLKTDLDNLEIFFKKHLFNQNL